MDKQLKPGERAVVEPLKGEEIGEMDAIFERVIRAIEGSGSNLVLSVLAQVLISSIPGEELDEKTHYSRFVALLGALNIMRDGYKARERDQTSLAEATHDLTAIAMTGSRPVVLPAMVMATVNCVANGRKDVAAEELAVTSIGKVLDTLHTHLGAV